MNTLNVIYHLARADFLERVRRYSFLVMLGAVVFLGYQAAIGNVSLQLGSYRGEFNSAWAGSMMGLACWRGYREHCSSPRLPWRWACGARATGCSRWSTSPCGISP